MKVDEVDRNDDINHHWPLLDIDEGVKGGFDVLNDGSVDELKAGADRLMILVQDFLDFEKGGLDNLNTQSVHNQSFIVQRKC